MKFNSLTVLMFSAFTALISGPIQAQTEKPIQKADCRIDHEDQADDLKIRGRITVFEKKSASGASTLYARLGASANEAPPVMQTEKNVSTTRLTLEQVLSSEEILEMVRLSGASVHQIASARSYQIGELSDDGYPATLVQFHDRAGKNLGSAATLGWMAIGCK